MKRKRCNTKRTIYSVGGKPNNGSHGWFNSGMPDNGSWSNFVSCKTFPHALRQFARVPGNKVQIDARLGGKPLRVVKFRAR